MADTTPAEATPAAAAPAAPAPPAPAHNLPEFNYAETPGHHHILMKPFYALAHHICDVIKDPAHREQVLGHLRDARTAAAAALPDEPTTEAP